MKRTEAEIITIGNEILTGHTVDTNSAWIALKLDEAGIDTRRIVSAPDEEQAIEEALRSSRARTVFITGGLGPTKDDITKKTLARYFGSQRFVTHHPTLDFIAENCARRGIAVNETNARQAEVPEGCSVIFNTCGTAPGMIFRDKDRIFVAMPGVPREMKRMLQDAIAIVAEELKPTKVYHRMMMTYGIAESTLSEVLAPIESRLPEGISLAYLPAIETGVGLRLTSKLQHGEELIAKEFEKIQQLLGKKVYGYEPDTLESVVGALLLERKATVSTAESCTGGTLAGRISSVAGSSRWFRGGVVAYSDQAKTELAGVDALTVSRYGAVSREVAEQMAEGIARRMSTDYGVATTGIAGPGGGTPETPIGLCLIAVAGPKGTSSLSINTMHNRTGNIIAATSAALNALRRLLDY
ncbi:MAG: CinA family nicotinamide mononucleotide deamidase-related protein [Prevotellaceae bacterium]|jgi:nicotinamide-nucleotide amidase|nr:CinA family nicotinamide mononucleotide deamidase-related protein [Prevotellaceae bacterium]